MPRFPIINAGQAPDQVANIYHDFAKGMGFFAAPNFIKIQGTSPSVVKGTWGVVENVLIRGELPRSLKEMIFVTISVDRNCRYCEAAHAACCRMLGVDEKTLATLLQDYQKVLPKSTQVILQFSVKCARNPQDLQDEDIQSLRDQGMSDSEIIEVIAMSALAVYATTIADAMQVETDEMFNI